MGGIDFVGIEIRYQVVLNRKLAASSSAKSARKASRERRVRRELERRLSIDSPVELIKTNIKYWIKHGREYEAQFEETWARLAR